MIRLAGVLFLLLAATTVTADECTLSVQGLTTPPAVEAGPTAVILRVYVIDIIEIADDEQSFTADVFLRAEWDDARLGHSGPGACFISIARVWNPRLQLLNRRIVKEVRPRDLEVTPDGKVIQVMRGFGKFSFRADYTRFPFDEQELAFNIQSGYGEDLVKFEVQPDLIAIAENLTTANWQIELAKHRVFTEYLAPTERHHARLDVVMHAKRRTGYYTWQELVPLFLVVMMSWVVFWIPREFVPPRIGLAATAMLTLMAYRFAVSKVLPPIAYLTKLDLFMVGASVLVFGALACAVAVTYLEAHVSEASSARVNQTARWLLPLLFVLVATGALLH